MNKAIDELKRQSSISSTNQNHAKINTAISQEITKTMKNQSTNRRINQSTDQTINLKCNEFSTQFTTKNKFHLI